MLVALEPRRDTVQFILKSFINEVLDMKLQV